MILGMKVCRAYSNKDIELNRLHWFLVIEIERC